MKTLVKYGFIFCLAFFLAGTAGYIGVGLFTKSAKEIILPELKGKNIIHVLETLTRLGLNPKLHGTQYHSKIPKYGVTFQDPIPGSTIKKGRDVVITISKGPKENLMPDLRQLPLEQALLALEKNELEKGVITRVYSSNTQKNIIIAQYPLPFKTVLRKSFGNLLVSKGPEPRAQVMPDLKGVALQDAVTLIETLGLEIGRIISKAGPKRSRGSILSQVPYSGSPVTADSPITLVVNDSLTGLETDPDNLKGLVLVSHNLDPGYLNRHVRVETDLLGFPLDIYNQYMKPGKEIKLLIPGGIRTKVSIFIDKTLVLKREITPWYQASDKERSAQKQWGRIFPDIKIMDFSPLKLNGLSEAFQTPDK